MSEAKNIRIPKQLRNFRKERLSMALYNLLVHPEKIEQLQERVQQDEYSQTCQIRVQFDREAYEWIFYIGRII
jgi:hypothetical protein